MMTDNKTVTDKKNIDDTGIQRTAMQKELVISRLRERGCRITRQRMILLDIILGEECSSCKEIYYKAAKQDSKIGNSVQNGEYTGGYWGDQQKKYV